jgi:hypothetical protein
MMNVNLLYKAFKRMQDEPRRADMRVGLDTSDVAPCGTVGCIAGHVYLCLKKTNTLQELIANNQLWSWWDILDVEEQLGESYYDWSLLWFESNWPDDLESALRAVDIGSPEYVNVIGRAIRWFIIEEGTFDDLARWDSLINSNK